VVLHSLLFLLIIFPHLADKDGGSHETRRHATEEASKRLAKNASSSGSRWRHSFAILPSLSLPLRSCETMACFLV
jgi:hypothetical protein